VIVNRYFFADYSSAIAAIAQTPIADDSPIDRIYVELREGTFQLIYDRQMRELYSGRFPSSPGLRDLAIDWLPHLLDRAPDPAFLAVKELVQGDEPVTVIPDVRRREPILQLGEIFADRSVERYKELLSAATADQRERIDKQLRGDIEGAVWFVERFLHDPEPVRNGGQFDYDKKIRAGEDPGVITGIRSRLPWIIQKLAVVQETTPAALGLLTRLIRYDHASNRVNEENLYVVQQSVVPLIEIAKRRAWLSNEERDQLHGLVFTILREYGRYPAIASFLIPLFLEDRDRTEAEAREILRHLSHIPQSAPLFIYFAIYRKQHFGGRFESAPFEELLEDQIKNGPDPIKAEIAWNLWRIVHEQPEQFEAVWRYLNLLVETAPLEGSVEDHLASLIEDSIAPHPQEASLWFIRLLRRRLGAPLEGRSDPHRMNFHFYKEIMEGIARRGDAPKFMEALELIVQLLERDARTIVYDIREIFGASQLLPDPDGKRRQAIDHLWSSLGQSRSWIGPNWMDQAGHTP
jgi:hypothetical protein